MGGKSLDLILNHPVQNLVWTTKRNDLESYNVYNNYISFINNISIYK